LRWITNPVLKKLSKLWTALKSKAETSRSTKLAPEMTEAAVVVAIEAAAVEAETPGHARAGSFSPYRVKN